MEHILLVEPNYKNKYPPIGLMKFSTYFKSKGDFVQFHKGLMPSKDVKFFDKVFITTLFTFDFDMCIETIRYYTGIVGCNRIYVGGIAATIMPERFTKAVPGINLLTGQMTSSNVLGYEDNINIDILELDYDILWDIPFEYPAADSYFIYTSRGCPRKCPFCAVKTLEPNFYECENVRDQVLRVDFKFGKKRNLLIMDNNSLHAPHLSQTIQALVDLGFGKDNNSARKSNTLLYMLDSLFDRIKIGKSHTNLLNRIKSLFLNLTLQRIRNSDLTLVLPLIKSIHANNEEDILEYLETNRQNLVDFYGRYNYQKIKRYVDFNQGLDARLFSDENAKLLAKIALKPCRIAFDDIRTKSEYFKALDVAINHGILHFSNYLLYNYEDKPEDLWTRLYLNVDYCEKNANIKSLFSFPMKYASIEYTDRSYIGTHWNKKYLKSINVILNVTSGVVAKEKSFFLRAFGRDLSEFHAILTMPDDFIRYRDFFDTQGFISAWNYEYNLLDENQRHELIAILSNVSSEVTAINHPHALELDRILRFYIVRKSKMEKLGAYYRKLLNIL